MGLAQALQGQEKVWRWRPIPMASMAWKTMRGRVSPDTLARAQAQGMRIAEYLDRNDAYGFFDALGIWW